MSFKSGSRKLPIRLQFTAQVEDTVRPGDSSTGRAAKVTMRLRFRALSSLAFAAQLHAPFEIQSELSEPFVVMTHDGAYWRQRTQLAAQPLADDGVALH